MPKDRRVNSSSFDHRAMVCPYSCSSRISDLANPETFSPHAGYEKEWEEALCPICMDHPHNAVLLLCSSREKGCRPFICDTSYRHSNCLDQFQKSTSSLLSSQSQLVCPLCRGTITGWDVINPARIFMNSKTRNCSLETCNFNGNYAELRKHARRAHPFQRPSQATPSRQSDWALLEQQMEIEDVLAHQSDVEHDWGTRLSLDELGENGLWSDGSFDFPSGMPDIEDNFLIDEMYSGLSMSFMSLYPAFPEEELIDSGSSRSTVMGLLLNDQEENDLGNLRSMLRSSDHNSENEEPNLWSRSSDHNSENEEPNLWSRSSHHNSENEETDERSRLSHHRENEETNERPRLSHLRGNEETNEQSRLSHRRGNEETNERTRSSHRRDNGSASGPRLSDQRSNYREENLWVSRPRSSNRGEIVRGSSGTRSSYWEEYTPMSSRSWPRYDRIWW